MSVMLLRLGFERSSAVADFQVYWLLQNAVVTNWYCTYTPTIKHYSNVGFRLLLVNQRAKMPVDQFDYSDPAIAFRALARLAQSGETRAMALDLIWQETRERALQLYPRVVTALDPDTACAALAALEDAVALVDGFVSTQLTPDVQVMLALKNLLAAIGIELARILPNVDQVTAISRQESIWDYHVISADLRQSRLAGTGAGGRELSPLDDAIRRLTTMLIGAGFLEQSADDAKRPVPGCDFGMAQLRATRRFVQASLAPDRPVNECDVGAR
jgi:hypothetical protein